MHTEELKDLFEQQMKTFISLKDRQDSVDDRVKAVEKTALEAVKLAGRPKKSEDDTDKNNPVDEFNEMRRAVWLSAKREPPPAIDWNGLEDYRSAFRSYLRHGDPNQFNDAERKAMSVGSDPDGGYLVVPDMGGRIARKVYETSPMRRIASVQNCGSDALEGLNDLGEFSSGWVSETGTRTATNTPQIGQWRIPVHEQYAMPELTQKMLDDSGIDIEQYVGDKIGQKFGRLENTAFVSGSGVGQPRGLTSYLSSTGADSSRLWGTFYHVLTGTNASFGSAPNGTDKLIELVHSLKAEYRANASWIMNKLTLGAVRQLKDGDNRYLVQESMLSQSPAMLLGYPITEMEDLPNYSSTAGTNAIWFGDFAQGYQIVDRLGLRTVRDPFTNKPYVRFYSIKRVGGDAINFECLRALKFST